jgi:hypothetical protein
MNGIDEDWTGPEDRTLLRLYRKRDIPQRQWPDWFQDRTMNALRIRLSKLLRDEAAGLIKLPEDDR